MLDAAMALHQPHDAAVEVRLAVGEYLLLGRLLLLLLQTQTYTLVVKTRDAIGR